MTNTLVPTAPGKVSSVTVGDHRIVFKRTDSGAVIKLVSVTGDSPIEIEITPSGPLLRLRTGVSIVVEGPLSVGAETVSICARKELSLSSEGEVTFRARGEITSEAKAQTIVARARDVKISANDDVVMNGERIRLNG
jgi:hypothetical protein